MANHNGDFEATGTGIFQSIKAAAGPYRRTWINASEQIFGEYVEHELRFTLDQAAGADVVAQTKIVGVLLKPCRFIEAYAVHVTKPDGAGGTPKYWTADIKRAAVAGAFGSILPAVFTMNAAIAAKTPQYQTIVNPNNIGARGDMIEILIAVAGSTGTQAQEIMVGLKAYEQPE